MRFAQQGAAELVEGFSRPPFSFLGDRRALQIHHRQAEPMPPARAPGWSWISSGRWQLSPTSRASGREAVTAAGSKARHQLGSVSPRSGRREKLARSHGDGRNSGSVYIGRSDLLWHT